MEKELRKDVMLTVIRSGVNKPEKILTLANLALKWINHKSAPAPVELSRPQIPQPPEPVQDVPKPEPVQSEPEEQKVYKTSNGKYYIKKADGRAQFIPKPDWME